jgi:hypothetical protein
MIDTTTTAPAREQYPLTKYTVHVNGTLFLFSDATLAGADYTECRLARKEAA